MLAQSGDTDCNVLLNGHTKVETPHWQRDEHPGKSFWAVSLVCLVWFQHLNWQIEVADKLKM